MESYIKAMLALGKKIDYALISLAFMAQRGSIFVSAREIAESSHLPLAALMQILKVLHNQGVLQSTRGVKGGYCIGLDLSTLTLFTLSEMLDAAEEEDPEKFPPMADPDDPPMADPVDQHPTLIATRAKLSEFLRDVRISDIIVNSKRRIDVPLNDLKFVEKHRIVSV